MDDRNAASIVVKKAKNYATGKMGGDTFHIILSLIFRAS
jgi:hypothetical protein